MATRDVVVRIQAEIGAFKRDMDAAAAKAKETAKKTEEAGKASESGIGRLAQTAQAHEQAWNQVSTGMVASGVAVVGALTLSTKAAMDWESAWAGVTKTVEGTPAQYAELETGLRKLARTLPSTHAEIAGVAEAAGQLGVARDDILGFTKTMIDLGESTNLTAEDAATNIAQISNVMGTMEREGAKGVERFGSALVALGNDGASTEAEILSMAQRISGAGATLGATEADVLALSNTLASMGVRAELGGGVTTRVLLKMRSAVDEGGESLDAFAKIAGLSADEFGAKFKAAPIEALDLVSKGIYRVNEAGGNVTATLKDMGIKGTEETQVMLALANSGDLLADSLELGAKAWSENTALVDEATKRYETAESKVKIAWNNIKDAAISAGSVILPVVADIAGVVADLAGAFSDLPGPVQTALVVLGGLAGTVALLGGALMKIVPNVQATVGGMRALGDAMGMTNRNAGKVPGGLVTIDAAMSRTEKRAKTLASTAAKAGQAVLMLAMVGPTVGSMVSSGDLAQLDSLNASLLNTSTVGAELDKAFTGKGNWFDGLDVGGLEEAFRVIGNPSFAEKADQNISKILTFGSRSSSDFEFVKKNFEQLDGALAGMAKSGNAEAAAESYEVIAEKAEAAGVPVEKLAEIFPQYAAALQLAAAEGGNADFSKIAADLEATGASAESAAEKIDDFYAAMVNAGMVVLGEREALRGMQEAFDAAGAAAAENGKNLDTTTEKGRANQAALDGIASATLRAMEAQREAGASTAELGATISEGREAFIENAVAMGMSEKAAAALADKLNLIPGAVYIQFDSNTDDLAGKLTEIHELVQSTPDGKVTIEENSPVVISALEALGYIVTTLPDGRIQVSETGTDSTGKKIDETAGKKRTAKINTEAITGAAETALKNAARDRSSTITANAATGGAEAQLNWVARPRTSSIKQTITKEITSIDNGTITGQFGKKKDGGRLPGHAGGGRLPATGLGTDKILGVAPDGTPLSWVDDLEWVVNRKSSDKYDRVLGMINRDDPAVQHLAGLKSGGRVGWSQGQDRNLSAAAKNATAERKKAERELKAANKAEDRAQNAYSKVGSKKSDKARKASAKRALDAAKREAKATKQDVDRLKKAEDAAKDALADSKARTGRLSDLTFDLRRDLKRGSVTDSFTSGSGMSIVDRMFEQSNNKDLSKSQRGRLRSLAYKTESELLRLEKQSDKLATSLDKAKSKRDELLSVKNDVASKIRGGFSLQASLDEVNSASFKKPNAKSLLGSVQARAGQMKEFGAKIEKLRKKGYSAAIIQEVVSYGIDGGTELADILLSATGAEMKAFNSAYKSMDKYAADAGESVTNAMHKGGIDAAQGLVDGLESKTKDVENAFYKLGKSAEKAFKNALGIKSPSKVLRKAGQDTGDGAILGGLDKIPEIERAYGAMGDAAANAYNPALAVPASLEVARYASAASSRSVEYHYHIDAKPGLAHQYAQDIANQTSTRVGDAMAAHGI